MTNALIERLLGQVTDQAGHNPTQADLTNAATRIVDNLPGVDTRYARATINQLLGDQHPEYYHLLATAAALPAAEFAPQALVGALVAAATERVGGRVAA